MRKDLKYNPVKEGIELERRRVLRQAYGYRHELYQLAFKRLRRSDPAQQVVDKAIAQLGDKENLEKLKHILWPWLQVYVNHLCDRYEIHQTHVFNYLNGQDSHHRYALERTVRANDTLRIVRQMKNNLTRSISLSSPAA